MSSETVVLVSDAHLGYQSDSSGKLFHRFLREVPRVGTHLVINGDLFDFWFEYRRVISRRAFATLSVLREIREAGLRLTVTGGNHDRWGGRFWIEEMGADFFPSPVELPLAGFRAFLAHGDGLAESRRASRWMHRVTRHPLTAGAFRLIHPDLGFWLADRLSRVLAEQTRDAESLAAAARVQERFAIELLGTRPDIDLVILGHTHRPALRAAGSGRWYVNPGAWMDERAYAILRPGAEPELKRFD